MNRFAPRITRLDCEGHRLIEPAGCIRKHCGITLPAAGLPADPVHLHTPRQRSPIDGPAVEQRRHGDRWPLVLPQAADQAVDCQLPTTHERGRARIDTDAPLVLCLGILNPAVGSIAVGFLVALHIRGRPAGDLIDLVAGYHSWQFLPWHPPCQSGRLQPHTCRRCHAGPRSQQPRRGGEHALGCCQRIDTGQRHDQGQGIREPHGHGAIDDGFHRHGGEPLCGPPLQGSHHGGYVAIRMRFHEHGIDQVVVQFRMLPLDHAGRVDQIDAIPHQRQDPADTRGDDRHEGRQQPRPPGPPRQAPRDQPVFEHHAKRHPDQCGQSRPEQKRRDRDPLEVGARGSKTLGEITLRFGVGLAVVAPSADGEGLGG